MKSWFKKVFVPHEGNNNHPHFWRDNSIALLLAIILIVELGVFAQSYLLFNKDSYLAAILPGVLAALTNEQRVENSAAPLTENPLLTKAAEEKASDMATRGYFSHNTPEGYLPWYWLDKVGYTYSHAGENLAVNFTDSKDVVDAWMNSPTHRANIVKQVYTETGIGMAEGTYQGKPAIYVAQFFGTPPAQVPAAPVAAVPVVATATPASTVTTATVTPAAATSVPRTVAVAPVKVTVPIVASAKTTVKKTSNAASPKITESIATTSGSTSAPEETGNTTVLALASTTTGPEVEGAVVDSVVMSPSLAGTLMASPRHAGTAVLSIILGVVIAAFLLILLVNGKVHHPRITLMMVSLIVIIVGVLVLNTRIFKDNLIIGQGDASSTVEAL